VWGCYIYRCDKNAWDVFKMRVADPKNPQGVEQAVEGQKEYYYYDCKTDYSRLRVARNAETAFKQAGFTIVYHSGNTSRDYTITARKGPLWVMLETGSDRYFVNTVLEKEMVQEMKASAESWMTDIDNNGHAAVYGILFDTDQATLKSESAPTLTEVVKLLKTNPALRLYVVGHTDNTGDFSHNMKLSDARAGAVVAALVKQHSVDPARLKPVGVGPVAPVDSNKTETGRARNRRVELVSQ
jgi:outer membrane protein OmpA-like peptidoglycan-associated protein